VEIEFSWTRLGLDFGPTDFDLSDFHLISVVLLEEGKVGVLSSSASSILSKLSFRVSLQTSQKLLTSGGDILFLAY